MQLPRHALSKNPVQTDTLDVVRFLYKAGFDARAECVFERAHPSWAVALPAIKDLTTGRVYQGFSGCLQFYEEATGIANLDTRARAFKDEAPLYAISDTDRAMAFS
jgi:hypothetical protein